MTQDTTTARERLEETISDSCGFGEYQSCDDGGISWLNICDVDDTADAVIQYLWGRADDPEVIAEVSDHIRYLMRCGGMMSDEDRAGGIIDALLIPLLGPRPSGEEAADER